MSNEPKPPTTTSPSNGVIRKLVTRLVQAISSSARRTERLVRRQLDRHLATLTAAGAGFAGGAGIADALNANQPTVLITGAVIAGVAAYVNHDRR